jgi:D-glucosaminate-6-phosphate ammonia-lyase
MDIYARFGVERTINAAGTLTRLGGSRMPDEVLDAMRAAAAASVDMPSLQAAASVVIARHTGAEAGMVTTGASAALTLAAAACLTGLDPARMERLPDTQGMADEILIARTHRTGYDHALRAAGARLVDVGLNDRGTGAGVRGVEPWEYEAAIGPCTVAIAYTATPANDPPLEEVVRTAHAHGLKVIVDAAAQLPPKANLRRFTGAGADLVAFSGGKAIRGPQASGILAGGRALIASALLQQQDMDVPQGAFVAPPELFPDGAPAALPHHGIGRGFKAGKEEIVGLLVALERFVATDDAAEVARLEERLALIQERIGTRPGLGLRLRPAAETGRTPVLALEIDAPRLGLGAGDLTRRLREGRPPVLLSERFAPAGILLVEASALDEADDALLADRIRAALGPV